MTALKHGSVEARQELQSTYSLVTADVKCRYISRLGRHCVVVSVDMNCSRTCFRTWALQCSNEYSTVKTVVSGKMKEKVKATQLCPTLCDPMDYTVCEILHAGILEWVAFPSPGDFPIQFSNPGLLHWRLILYHLSQNNIAVSSLSLSSGSS